MLSIFLSLLTLTNSQTSSKAQCKGERTSGYTNTATSNYFIYPLTIGPWTSSSSILGQITSTSSFLMSLPGSPDVCNPRSIDSNGMVLSSIKYTCENRTAIVTTYMDSMCDTVDMSSEAILCDEGHQLGDCRCNVPQTDNATVIIKFGNDDSQCTSVNDTDGYTVTLSPGVCFKSFSITGVVGEYSQFACQRYTNNENHASVNLFSTEASCTTGTSITPISFGVEKCGSLQKPMNVTQYSKVMYCSEDSMCQGNNAISLNYYISFLIIALIKLIM